MCFNVDGKVVVGLPNNRPVVATGDQFLFHKFAEVFGMPHLTVCDSLVYHIQEGEMDE